MHTRDSHIQFIIFVFIIYDENSERERRTQRQPKIMWFMFVYPCVWKYVLKKKQNEKNEKNVRDETKTRTVEI